MTAYSSRASGSGPARLWSVVLAGGAGRRLASVTGGVPKQYWRPGGGPSLLDATRARTAPVAPSTRTVLVVDRSHAGYLAESMAASVGHVLFQPGDRGTGAGLYLGLLPVLDAHSDAIVLVTPADHGIAQPHRFRSTVLEAAATVQRGDVDVMLFGAEASEPCTDYGWIVPGGPAGPGRSARFRRVLGFVEKPPLEAARALHRSGALWSTLVIVARAAAIVQLFRRLVPDAAALFDAAARVGGAARDARLADAYASLAPVDLSRDILTAAGELAVTVWPASIGWTDLGTPERLRQWRAAEAATPARAPRRSPARVAS
jgi:mannose-1-phosphate guanylyltransferase